MSAGARYRRGIDLPCLSRAFHYLLVLVLIFLSTLIGFMIEHSTNSTRGIASVFTLAVLFATRFLGLDSGLVAAVLSAVTFDFFFVAPVYTHPFTDTVWPFFLIYASWVAIAWLAFSPITPATSFALALGTDASDKAVEKSWCEATARGARDAQRDMDTMRRTDSAYVFVGAVRETCGRPLTGYEVGYLTEIARRASGLPDRAARLAALADRDDGPDDLDDDGGVVGLDPVVDARLIGREQGGRDELPDHQMIVHPGENQVAVLRGFVR